MRRLPLCMNLEQFLYNVPMLHHIGISYILNVLAFFRL